MSAYIKTNGTVQAVKKTYVKFNGSWSALKTGWIKSNGTWKKFYAGGFPDWYPSNLQYGSGWLNFQSALLSVNASSPSGTESLTVYPNSPTVGTLQYGSSVVLQDGRILGVPRIATKAFIFNPATNVYTLSRTDFPNSTYVNNPPGEDQKFIGGILLPDGRVFFLPGINNRVAAIYDPVNDTATIPTGVYTNWTGGATGGVLLPDGRVFMIPSYRPTARIYNPSTDSLIEVSGLDGGNPGAVLLPDGRVFLTPTPYWNKTYIFNPSNNSFTSTGQIFPVANYFSGSVLLPNGKVFLVPGDGRTAYVYDPIINSVAAVNGNFPVVTGGGQSYKGGILMADGRVFCIPFNVRTATIYNPVYNSITSSAVTWPTTAGIVDKGSLMKDGRIFLPPSSGPAQVYDPNISTSLDLDINLITSPFFNKA